MEKIRIFKNKSKNEELNCSSDTINAEDERSAESISNTDDIAGAEDISNTDVNASAENTSSTDVNASAGNIRAADSSNDGTLNMTSGNPYKVIVQFALPILLSQVFQQLYNTADTFIVGKFLGTEALAAVSSSGNLIFMLISFIMGASMGAGVVISRFFGAGDRDSVSKAIHTNVLVGLIASVFMTIFGVLLTPTFLSWMNVDAAVMPKAVEYFRYYFWGVSTIIMYNVLKGIMNAIGDSKRPLYYLIISSLLNIALDYVFIGVFGWGVWAAAVATVISQLASCILCLMHLMQKGHIYTIEPGKLAINKRALILMLKYGLPSGIQNSVIGFANVIVQSQINSFGMMAMAAFGTYAKIEGFAFLPIMSFTMSITTFVSQNLGAEKKERAKKGATFGILVSVGLAELIGIAIYLAAPSLIGLFDSSAQVVALGTTQAHIEALFYGILAFAHAVAAVCRGAGKAFVPMFIMLSVWCVLRIAYIYAVMHLFGEIQYIYSAYPLTWGISGIIYLIYYLKSNWTQGFSKA